MIKIMMTAKNSNPNPKRMSAMMDASLGDFLLIKNNGSRMIDPMVNM